jgi:hypothetical protein
VTHIETSQTKRTPERAPRQLPGLASYWLIVKHENGRIEALTLVHDGEQILPVFGHEEEAEMFLRLLRGVGEDWRVSESGAEELISVLYGPCASVKEVALDPLPEMVAERTVGLVSLFRERFIEFIAARRRRTLRLCELDRGSLPCEDVSHGKKPSAFEQRQGKHEGGDVERAMFLASLRA